MSESIDALLAEAFTDPSAAIETATAMLADSSEMEQCGLLRVIGNARREQRRIDESIDYLNRSLALAVSIGNRRLEGNAAMSLAATLSYQGEFGESLDTVERAIDLLEGDDLIVAMSQKAGLLQRAGRQYEALSSFDEALIAADGVADQTILGDLWMNRGVLHGFVGNIQDAVADTQNAHDLFEEMGWAKRTADMKHNLAWLAGRRGDLVEALERFDGAELAYRQAGISSASVFPDRCEVLIAAGLADEALTLAELAAREFARQGDQVDAAESLTLVARAALLSGDVERALSASEQASERFVEQGREGWQADATILQLEARLRLDQADKSDRERALSSSVEAASAGLMSVSAGARLIGAEIALKLDGLAACAADIELIEPVNLRSPDRYRLDLLRARLAAGAGRHDEAFEICSSGLKGFNNISAALGGTELRAHIARHVEELVDFGVSLAVEDSDPALVLAWAERQRAPILSTPPVLPPPNPDLERELNLLRSAISELEARAEEGSGIREAQDRCVAAQDRVRRLTRHLTGDEYSDPDARSLSDLLEDATTSWIVFVESGRHLHSIRVEGGAVVVTEIGQLADIQSQIRVLQSGLTMHLTAVGRGVASDPAAIVADAERLDGLLFPEGGLSTGRVVVCPTGQIYDVPWGLLPTLSPTAFVLAPSIDSYYRCASMVRDAPGSIVAIAGPDLQLAADEATAVCADYPSSEFLTGDAATVANAKNLMQNIDVAHLACHGRFVSGNPMFSALELWDGQIFVHEIERIRPAPQIAVLSACNAGLHSSPTGRQTLGLTTSLLASGSRSVVAATVPIPDTISLLGLMCSLHTSLAAGVDVASALSAIRSDDPVLGGVFSCHGASWRPEH